MRQFIYASLAVVIATTLVASGTVSAQLVSGAMTEQLCERGQGRLPSADSLKETRASYDESYQSALDILDKYVESSEAQGQYETDALMTPTRESLQSAVAEYDSRAKEYEATIESLSTIACPDDYESFNTKLSTAREQLTATREATEKVNDIIQQDVVRALDDYAAWISLVKINDEVE